MSNRTAEIAMKIKDYASTTLASINSAMGNIGQTATASGMMATAAIDKTNKELVEQQKRVLAVASAFDEQHKKTLSGMASIGSVTGALNGTLGGIGTAATKGFGLLSSAAGYAWKAVKWVADEVWDLAKWGLVSLAGALAYSTKAWIDEEQSIVRLGAVYRATGGVVGYTTQQLDAYAGQLQKVTGIADDTWRNAMGVMLTFRDVQGSVFKEAMVLAADMSAVMGGDLQSAVLQVGKALQDPEQGLTALKRAGVSFSDAQKEQIKLLVESGELYKAQAIILGELKQEFGGAAAALQGTLGGSLKALWNSIGDAAETVGKAFAPIFEDAAEAIRQWVEDSQPRIEAFAKTAAEYVEFAGTAIGEFFDDGSTWAAKWQFVWGSFLDVMEAAIRSAVDLAIVGGARIGGAIANGIANQWNLGSALQIVEGQRAKGVFASDADYQAARKRVVNQFVDEQNYTPKGQSDTIALALERSGDRFGQAGRSILDRAGMMMPDFGSNIASAWAETQQRIADISSDHANATKGITDAAKEGLAVLQQHEQVKRRIVELDRSAAQQYLSMTALEKEQTKWLLRNSNTDIGSMTAEMQKAISGSSILSKVFEKPMLEFMAKDLGFKASKASGGGLRIDLGLTEEAAKMLTVVQSSFAVRLPDERGLTLF